MIENQEDLKENKDNNKQGIPDKEYYSNLKYYKPLCYRGMGSPFLMLNQQWYSSLACLAFSDVIYICVMVLFVARYHPDEPQTNESDSYFSFQPQKPELTKQTILLINVGIFIYLNLTYLLTQFMNPGVINLSTISNEYYEKNGGKIFCSSCNGYRSKHKIAHCKSCDVCVWGLDHHCGFFNKCIAGYQAWAFYGLMLGAFAAFVGALVTISLGLL